MLQRIPALLLLILQASIMVAQPSLSDGVYRIPYSDGTSVRIAQDWSTHSPVGRIDMVGQGSGPHMVVAAADGVIKWIDDSHAGSCSLPGCSGCNNYVWIEHANGEWTKYTHFQTGSVQAQGRFVGETVCAGAELGFEGAVGFTRGGAGGPTQTTCDGDADIQQRIIDSINAGVTMTSFQHLHFEVAVPDDPTDPFDTIGGFINGFNRIPVFCGPAGGMVTQGNSYTANPCGIYFCFGTILLPDATLSGPTSVFAGSLIDTDNSDYRLNNGARILHQAGDRIELQPGFEASFGAEYEGRIRPCLSSPTSTGCSGSVRMAQDEKLNPPTGSSWRVFPNPSDGQFGILRASTDLSAADESFSVEIFDPSGRRVLFRQNLLNSQLSVDLRDYPAGMYMVRIHEAGQTTNHRVAISH